MRKTLISILRKLLVVVVVLVSIAAALFFIMIGVFIYMSRPYDLAGPDSPTGLTVVAHISDCGLMWSDDHYTDVAIYGEHGNAVANWRDSGGQQSRAATRALVESMKWTDESTLEFTADNDTVTISVQ